MRGALLPLLLLLSSSLGAAAQSASVDLTVAERAWLAKHPVIRIGPAPAYPPVEFIEGGRYRGIAADVVARLEQLLDVRFEVVAHERWSDCVEAAKARRIDAWPEAGITEERQRYMRFSRPYLVLPTAIIVRRDTQGPLTLDALRGKKVVVIAGYATETYIAQHHPAIDRISAPDLETGLRLVSFGGADAIVANLATSTWLIERGGLTNLRVAGETDFRWQLAFATRSDWPLLASIVQKGLDAIGEAEREQIYRRWVGVQRDAGWRPTREQVAGAALGLLFLLAALATYWSVSLRRQVARRTRQLRRQEASLRAILDAVDSAVLILSPADGTILDANAPARERLGLTGDEEGVSLSRDLTPDASPRQTFDAELRAAVVQEQERRLNWRLAPRGAEPFEAEVALRPLDLAERTVVIACIRQVRDA